MENEVAFLLSQLSHHDPEVRQRAAEKLGDLQAVATIPALCEMLQDDTLGYFTRNTVGQAGEASVQFGLIGTVEEGVARLRHAAAIALGKIGAPALPELVKILYQPAPVPSELAYALGSVGLPALPVLLAALEDEREDVRGRAADAIGYVGDVSACPALLSLLYMDDPDVCWFAARSLVRLRHPGGIRVLLAHYASDLISGPGAKEIASLVCGLGVAAVPTLLVALETHWREAISARILLQIGDVEVLPRKILMEPNLAIEDKIELLTRLRKVRYSGWELYLRYDFPDVLTFCRAIVNNEDGEIQEVARIVVNHLTLLRGASADTFRQPGQLLRPTEPGSAEVNANEMLRAADASSKSEDGASTQWTLWKKLRRHLPNG